MKTTLRFAVAGTLVVCSCSALSEEGTPKEPEPDYTLSANVALATDYVFRGISQTDNEPAIQGGFDFNHKSGVYAGVWASNVDFGPADDTKLEMDLYAGYSSTFAEKATWSAGVLYYLYPDQNRDNYLELLGSLGYDFGIAALTGGLAFSNDFFASSGDAVYYSLGATVPLPAEFKLNLLVGHQDIDDNDRFGTPDYTHYSVGASREFLGFNFDLSYQDTDIRRSECIGGTNLCQGRVVFKVSRKF